MTYIIGILGLLVISGALIFTLTNAPKSIQKASTYHHATDALWSTVFSAGFPHRYLSHTVENTLRDTKMTLKTWTGQELTQVSRVNFGGGIILGDTKLITKIYKPQQLVQQTGEISPGYKILFLSDQNIWADINVIKNDPDRSTGYNFLFSGRQYEIRWQRERGFWGLLGGLQWPASVFCDKKEIAQIMRKDARAWVGDFSNTVYYAAAEELDPHLLGTLCLLTCENFFPKHS